MLLLGLLVGGGGGFFLYRTGVLQEALGVEPTPRPTPTPTPTPTPVVERVTVETVRTPRQCLAAIDRLRDALEDLEDVRRRLMEGDIARSAGNQEIANRAYSDVDQALRTTVIALQGERLQSAIEECRALAEPETSRTPSPTPEAPQPTPPTEPTPAEEGAVPAPPTPNPAAT